MVGPHCRIATFLGIRTYEMHQFYDYLHQNWRADHKNALKQYQAAVTVIKIKSLCNIFLGHPVFLENCDENASAFHG